MSMSVCLSVCEHISGTARPIFANFCACCLWPWLGLPLAALRYTVCTSGFVDDVMFARNGPHGGMPISLQRVTLLRRRAQANAPASSYWLRRVLDESIVQGAPGAEPATRRCYYATIISCDTAIVDIDI